VQANLLAALTPRAGAASAVDGPAGTNPADLPASLVAQAVAAAFFALAAAACFAPAQQALGR